MTDTQNSPKDEVTRLRARIEELEAELSRKEEKKTEKKEKDLAESVRDMSNQAMDETSKIIRGLTYAYLEELRLAANVVNSFVDEVFQKNRGKEENSVRDLARNLPGDISSGVSKVIDESLDIPSKMIDKFYETYKEKEK